MYGLYTPENVDIYGRPLRSSALLISTSKTCMVTNNKTIWESPVIRVFD